MFSDSSNCYTYVIDWSPTEFCGSPNWSNYQARTSILCKVSLRLCTTVKWQSIPEGVGAPGLSPDNIFSACGQLTSSSHDDHFRHVDFRSGNIRGLFDSTIRYGWGWKKRLQTQARHSWKALARQHGGRPIKVKHFSWFHTINAGLIGTSNSTMIHEWHMWTLFRLGLHRQRRRCQLL